MYSGYKFVTHARASVAASKLRKVSGEGFVDIRENVPESNRRVPGAEALPVQAME